VDPAIRQYHDLKATTPSTYNFDEPELNDLGDQLIGAKKFKEAIRILQLNVEADPNSSNAYDRLAESLHGRRATRRSLSPTIRGRSN
jgi:serine-type D-Ala-D-Ala carboxypeptidase/endopeptidase